MPTKQLNSPPTRAPLVEPIPGPTGVVEYICTKVFAGWLAQVAAAVNAINVGGAGAAYVRNLDILGVGQVIDAPVVPSGDGQRFIYRLAVNNDPVSIVWGVGFDPLASTQLNYTTGTNTIFDWYSEDRGIGLLWYLSAPPYLP